MPDITIIGDPHRILAALVEARGGTPRDAQTRALNGIVQADYDGRSVVIEAPTGVGKSAVGLAVAGALPDDSQAVYSTHTKALQDQIRSIDLPVWEVVTGRTVGVLKGRHNYACIARVEEAATRNLDPDDLAVVDFARRGLAEGKAELVHMGIPSDPRRLVSIGWEDCPGKTCRHYTECPAVAATAKARAAHLIVVNHAIVAMAIVGKGAPLEPALAVFDEAHRLADAVRDQAGRTVRPGTFRALAGRIARKGGASVTVDDAMFFALPDGYLEPRWAKEASLIVKEETDRLRHAAGILAGNDRHITLQLANLLQTVDKLAAAGLDSGQPPAQWYASRQGNTIEARPTDVSNKIRAWTDGRLVVHMSATLATGPARSPVAALRFGPYLTEVGLHPEQVTAGVLPSPFPPDAALCWIPDKGPAPGHEDRDAWLAKAVVKLCSITDGRALLLATSYRAAQIMAIAVMADGRWPVLQQAQGESVAHLIERFRAEENSVLVGVDTLREGLDVPGPALSLLVYDKIPHLPPDDPYVRAMCGEKADGADPAWWNRYRAVDQPRVRLALTQAAGRLIRGPDDRGIVAVLDQRMWSGPASMRRALRWPVTSRLADVEAWWQTVRPREAEAVAV